MKVQPTCTCSTWLVKIKDSYYLDALNHSLSSEAQLKLHITICYDDTHTENGAERQNKKSVVSELTMMMLSTYESNLTRV